MPAARYVSISKGEDKQLQAIENNKHLHEKVRLRAKVIRLSNRGMSSEEISAYTGRKTRSILRDFDRWETEGITGLADAPKPGKPPHLNLEHLALLEQKLSEERNWTAPQLCEVINRDTGVVLDDETMRVALRKLGYRWKRHRYEPVKRPDPEAYQDHKASLELLKRGQKKDA